MLFLETIAQAIGNFTAEGCMILDFTIDCAFFETIAQARKFHSRGVNLDLIKDCAFFREYSSEEISQQRGQPGPQFRLCFFKEFSTS